ncbi:MAG TPA: YraN family protein [Kineosporiaceae bacterium]
MRASDAVGEYGERLAVRHLENQGFTILDQRWRCAQGEIDIIGVDDGCLVICEVKTRRSASAGEPAEAVTPVKLARLRRLTALWLDQQEVSWRDVRIDVVAVFLPYSGRARVAHLRAVG